MDWLKRAQTGIENSSARTERIRLLIPSGPIAFPTGRDFKISLTSSGKKKRENLNKVQLGMEQFQEVLHHDHSVEFGHGRSH